MQSPSKWDMDSYASLGLLRAGGSFTQQWILRSEYTFGTVSHSQKPPNCSVVRYPGRASVPGPGVLAGCPASLLPSDKGALGRAAEHAGLGAGALASTEASAGSGEQTGGQEGPGEPLEHVPHWSSEYPAMLRLLGRMTSLEAEGSRRTGWSEWCRSRGGMCANTSVSLWGSGRAKGRLS